MNCKPGDLAILVKSNHGNEGKIVRVLGLTRAVFFFSAEILDSWTYEGPRIYGDFGKAVEYIPDEYLRPIRDSDGEDETFEWAGKPAIAEATGSQG